MEVEEVDRVHIFLKYIILINDRRWEGKIDEDVLSSHSIEFIKGTH